MLAFNDTTNKDGIIQMIETTVYGVNGLGRITSNTNLLKLVTGYTNQASNEVWREIFKADGTWQFDDAGHADFPTIKTNLVSGQRDYTFVTDEQGNRILGIHKVYRANASGVYEQIYQVDAEGNPEEFVEEFDDGRNISGLPYRYNLTGNGIKVDPIPDYNYTNGLKVLVTREGVYFTYDDTTATPGFAGDFHELIPLIVSYRMCRDSGSKNTEQIKRDIIDMKKDLKDHYNRRSKDITQKLRNRENQYE